MKYKLGKVLRDSKREFKVEVMRGQEVVGIHTYDKVHCKHSLTESLPIEEEELFYIFNMARELVNNLLEVK